MVIGLYPCIVEVEDNKNELIQNEVFGLFFLL